MKPLLGIYRSLGRGERLLVWIAAIALIVVFVNLISSSASIVAVAQVVAAAGTLALAGLAYSQVRELRETRIAQERPHVIVDTDHSNPPNVYVVLRNIGRGAARNITFEFSATMEAPESVDNPQWVSIDKQPYFAKGIDYLAPDAEISCFWGSMKTLPNLLRERGLHDGITITSRYSSLQGREYETRWSVNPLLMADRLYPS